MRATHAWRGRRGSVLLGPTENRVARWLADMTRSGRATIRTEDLAEALRLERSEAYRIVARLRILGLFGVENDRGGTHGGRRFWRTAIEHDGSELDPIKHRTAWARLVAWSRQRAERVAARLAELRATTHAAMTLTPLSGHAATSPGVAHLPTPGDGTFAEAMRRNGLGRLMDQWKIGR